MKCMMTIILCVLLIACQTSIEGDWVSLEGSTELTFKDNVVTFFGVEGTYELTKDTLILTFATSVLEYGYELNADSMILYLKHGQLILKRK